MRVKYKGQRYILRPGFLISIDAHSVFMDAEPDWVDGVIVDMLALQFTASKTATPSETQILMFKGVGETWKPRM